MKLFGKPMLAAMSAGALIGCGVMWAARTAADPGDPMQGCETQLFATYCDGPIRPDGSWRRCTWTAPSYTGRVGVPGTVMCREISLPVPALPLGQPDHHIEA